ncbi:MAG: DegT/DnrJ/EryC1/StrS family aminotransferase [Bacteroidia bacterium]|nr:DegT/DnrJ/EryC1/StrS family aminotransferase [Bacteroidia bacterium]
MKVPFVDLNAQYNSIKSEIDNAIATVIRETSFIGGKHVEEFEKNFAALYGVKHCISLANGTDSLYVSMKMLGIGNGDEVITTAYSWISSSETISQTGAKPVFVDIDEFFTIDVEKLEEKITSKTKAIIPVHIHGQMCDMNKIMEIALKYNIPVIEDCAQSHFSEFKGIRAGVSGLVGSFSFYPGKNLGAYGDAGCLITNDDEFALKCKMYARHGALKKHQHVMEGINSRLDGIQAAILNVKLSHILKWTDRRISNANLYSTFLQDVDDIELPKVRKDVKHSYHLYVIKTAKRDKLVSFLKDNGVDTAIHYPIALHNMEAYKYLNYTRSDFPNASYNEDKILSLPMYPELSDEQIKYITELIKTFFKKNS